MALTVGLGTDVGAGDSTHWAYSGQLDPEHWKSQYPVCGNAQQSPIDINPDTASPMNPLPLALANYDTTEKLLHITNNGHTALIRLPKDYPQNRIPSVKDGGLPNQYNFAQLHLHWGSDASRGSEHTIKKKQFPAELHFVHYNTKYGTMENATKHPDGLAVLGVFVQIASQDNPAFKPIADILSKVEEEGHEEELKSTLILRDLIPASRLKFYRYAGSLTTPGCNEIVTWTVFDSPISISEKQISKLRDLQTENGKMVDNYRPVQKLGSRTVYVYSSASHVTIPLIGLVVQCALFFLNAI